MLFFDLLGMRKSVKGGEMIAPDLQPKGMGKVTARSKITERAKTKKNMRQLEESINR